MVYKVHREISDVEFEDEHIERLRKDIKRDMLDENPSMMEFCEDEINRRLVEKVLDIAKKRTAYDQGDNELMQEIEFGEVLRNE